MPRRRDTYRMCMLACLALPVACGCSDRKPYEGPAWNPEGAAERALAAYDSDGGGTIGPGELDGSPGLKTALSRIDVGLDGSLDAWEIASRISFYRDCGTLLLPCVCRVTLDGRPLAGATVRLVPDAFLGSVVEPATGVTDQEGNAEVTIEGAEQPGVHPGIYNVEISKKDAAAGETLPARYNQQTSLGYEAAPDGGPAGLKPEFQLTGK